MADKSSIVAGRGHVVLGVDTSALERGLTSAKAKIQSFSTRVGQIGAAMMAAGTAMAGMLTPGVMAFANYEQALADLRAQATPTADEFARIKTQIEAVSKATGMGPAEVTAAYTELLKAGVKLETVLGGVGEMTIKFARVSGMEMAAASSVLVNAMNIFSKEGLTASEIANIMSQAADSSTLSLRDMAEGFGVVGGTMANFGFTARDTATAIAMVGQFGGIPGGEAATQLNTFLSRLTKTSGESAEAIAELGFVFRDSNGKFLPMVEIIRNLQTAFAGLGPANKDRLMTMLGGMRGMRGVGAMLTGGVSGWENLQAQMEGNLTIEQKFSMMTDTLLGQLKRLWVHVQFVAIAVGAALGPSLRQLMDIALPLLEWAQRFVEQNQELVQLFAVDAAKALVFGAVLVSLGTVLYGIATAFGVIATIIGFAFSPVSLTILAIGIALATVLFTLHSFGVTFKDLGLVVDGIIGVWADLFPGVARWFGEIGEAATAAGATIKEAWSGIETAMAAGNFEMAWQIAFLGIQVAWYELITKIREPWDATTNFLAESFIKIVAGWQFMFAKFGQVMETVWASVVAAFKQGWNVFTTTAEIAAIRAEGFIKPWQDTQTLVQEAVDRGTARSNAITGEWTGTVDNAAAAFERERARINADVNMRLGLAREAGGPAVGPAELERLREQLRERIAAAWQANQDRIWEQEELNDAFGNAMRGRQPEEEREGGIAGSAIGTFGSAATAAMQLGGSSNPMQLIADRVAEQLRLHHEAHEQRRNLERQMQRLNDEFVRLPGLVVV